MKITQVKIGDIYTDGMYKYIIRALPNAEGDVAYESCRITDSFRDQTFMAPLTTFCAINWSTVKHRSNVKTCK